jgi:DNA processing protein
MIHPHALIYSSKQDITITQLKNADYDPSIDSSLIANYMSKHAIQATVEGEKNFPQKMHGVSSMPYIIYYQGNLDLLDKKILAIVWPRNHSEFAKIQVEKLIHQAKNHDIVTISGLAPGIDQLAHHLSWESNIPTIAVLWWGFHHFLKSKDREKIDHIVSQWWLVLSEFKISQAPTSYTFPQRNRIIAGLADLVYVPEASKNSGSLITVDFAHKLQKPIYGTPNFSSPQTSLGLHEYLQNWLVRPLFSLSMMLENHFPTKEKNPIKDKIPSHQSLDLGTQKLLQVLETTPFITISTLLQKWFPQDKIFWSLTRLEMERLIHQPVPGTYTLS